MSKVRTFKYIPEFPEINIKELKKYLPNISELEIKSYLSRIEKKELIRYGIILGAASAITVTALVLIIKKLRKSKPIQVVEVNTEDLDND